MQTLVWAYLINTSVLVLLVVFLGFLAFRYKRRCKKLQDKLAENLEVDLELATSDQLIMEMRNRPRSYLLMLPINDLEEGSFGLTVEVHNVMPVPATHIMKMAAVMSEKELRKQGVELPDEDE